MAPPQIRGDIRSHSIRQVNFDLSWAKNIHDLALPNSPAANTKVTKNDLCSLCNPYKPIARISKITPVKETNLLVTA